MCKQRVVVCVLFVLSLTVVCGCAKKPASNAPASLYVWADQSFYEYDAGWRVEFVYLQGLYASTGVEVWPSSTEFRGSVAPNEFNIYNRDGAYTVHHIGTAAKGNAELEIGREKLEQNFSDESEFTKQKLCTVGMAHEIGHCLLGKTHHRVGSSNNIMADSYWNLISLLRACGWPSFDAEQIQTIRKKCRVD